MSLLQEVSMNNSLFGILLLMVLGGGGCCNGNDFVPNSCDPLSLALCCMLFSSCVGDRFNPLSFSCPNASNT